MYFLKLYMVAKKREASFLSRELINNISVGLKNNGLDHYWLGKTLMVYCYMKK